MVRIHEDLSYKKLYSISDPKRIARSTRVTGPPLDINATSSNVQYTFNFKSNPSTTGKRWHGYVRFKRPTSEKHLDEVPCTVDCGCYDYRYRWAWANKQRGAGMVGSQSLNRAYNLAPRITNPTGKSGLCKHILAVKNWIDGMINRPEGGRDPEAEESLDRRMRRLADYTNRRHGHADVADDIPDEIEEPEEMEELEPVEPPVPVAPPTRSARPSPNARNQPSPNRRTVPSPNQRPRPGQTPEPGAGAQESGPILKTNMDSLMEAAGDVQAMIDKPGVNDPGQAEALQLLRDIKAAIITLSASLKPDTAETPPEAQGEELALKELGDTLDYPEKEPEPLQLGGMNQ